MTRFAVITGFPGSATVPAVPQAMAAGAPANAEAVSGTVETAEPLGRLGPLTDLVIERIRVSDEVAASKFGTDSPIEDPVRETQVLEQVRTRAEAAGVNPTRRRRSSRTRSPRARPCRRACPLAGPLTRRKRPRHAPTSV